MRRVRSASAFPSCPIFPWTSKTTVQPALAGRINGTPFDLKGETRPFHESRESSITLKLDGLDIPRYLAFSPVKLNFEVPAGKLNTDLRVTFRQAVAAAKDRPAQAAQTLVSGKFEVNGFALSAPAGAVGGAARRVEVGQRVDRGVRAAAARLVLADVVVDEACSHRRARPPGFPELAPFAQQPVRVAATRTVRRPQAGRRAARAVSRSR